MKVNGRRTLVTMQDVAKATGFSPATVSIVLNNAPLARYIAPGTREWGVVAQKPHPELVIRDSTRAI